MPLVSPSAMLTDARNGHYAVGSFTTVNVETLNAVLAAAEQRRSPVIVAVYRDYLGKTSLEQMAALVRFAAERSPVPVALHLDLAQGLEEVAEAIRYGFTSIMLDPQNLAYEEHARIATEMTRICHAVGATTEAELGAVGHGDGQAAMTDPGLARDFVRRTGIDILSVAIGSAHGGAAHLDLERLGRIREAVDCHLALHGGSGVSTEEMRQAMNLGINKASVFSAVARVAVKRLQSCLSSQDEAPGLVNVLDEMRAACQEAVAERIDFFNGRHTAVGPSSVEPTAGDADVRYIVERVMQALGATTQG